MEDLMLEQILSPIPPGGSERAAGEGTKAALQPPSVPRGRLSGRHCLGLPAPSWRHSQSWSSDRLGNGHLATGRLGNPAQPRSGQGQPSPALHKQGSANNTCKKKDITDSSKWVIFTFPGPLLRHYWFLCKPCGEPGFPRGAAILAAGLSRALRCVGLGFQHKKACNVTQSLPVSLEELDPSYVFVYYGTTWSGSASFLTPEQRDGELGAAGWRLNHFPGQPVPMLDNPLGEEKFPNIQSKPPLEQLEAISSCPIACYLGEETDPHLSTTSFQGTMGVSQPGTRLPALGWMGTHLGESCLGPEYRPARRLPSRAAPQQQEVVPGSGQEFPVANRPQA
ncbi:hypothetical protein QYF61_012480 [Mycteria americana]|uniref:Uncharacterized protein n=1 Tax=Mycteria americana TaxID=33587 RepID=A0AAN7NS46_MYCAM|nr:hypothetical protein QYF61_012480 [Mycteria americana]